MTMILCQKKIENDSRETLKKKKLYNISDGLIRPVKSMKRCLLNKCQLLTFNLCHKKTFNCIVHVCSNCIVSFFIKWIFKYKRAYLSSDENRIRFFFFGQIELGFMREKMD